MTVQPAPAPMSRRTKVTVRQAAKRNAAAIRAGRVDLRCGSVENLPALKAPLDKIMAVNSMASWPEKLTRLKELRDKLRPGGQIAIASQPRCPGATKATAEQRPKRSAPCWGPRKIAAGSSAKALLVTG